MFYIASEKMCLPCTEDSAPFIFKSNPVQPIASRSSLFSRQIYLCVMGLINTAILWSAQRFSLYRKVAKWKPLLKEKQSKSNLSFCASHARGIAYTWGMKPKWNLLTFRQIATSCAKLMLLSTLMRVSLWQNIVVTVLAMKGKMNLSKYRRNSKRVSCKS